MHHAVQHDLLTIAQAADLLGLGPRQVAKLIETGFLDNAYPAESGKTRVARTQVEALADYQMLDADPALPVLAVHTGPMQRDEHWSGRSHFGVDLHNRLGLNSRDRQLAWTGLWGVSEHNADAAIGGYLVASTAGFLDEQFYALRVTSYTRIDGSTLFFGDQLDEDDMALFRRRRIPASQGATWQWVNRPRMLS